MDLFPHICPKQGWRIGTKLLVVTVPLIVIVTGVTAWAVYQGNLANLSEKLMKRAEAIYTQTMADRRYYASVIVPRVAELGGTVGSGYREVHGQFPLPATFVREVSEQMDAYGAPYRMDLLSPWAINKAKGPKDQFHRDGFASLREHPKSQFVRTDTAEGRAVMRILMADFASAQSCVDCHNAHPQSPRHDFRLNDLMGGLEIVIPIDPYAQEARRDLLLAVAGGAGLCLLIAGIVAVGTGLTVTRPLSRLAGLMRLFAGTGEGLSPGGSAEPALSPVEGLTTGAGSAPPGDEVAQLEKTFEDMVEIIAHQQNQLRQANASLGQQVVERTQALQALVGASRQLTAELHLEKLLQRIVKTSQDLTKATHAALAVFDETEERLTRCVTVGMDEATMIEALSARENLLWLLAREKDGLRLKDLTQHPAFFCFPSSPPTMHSFLGVSIRAHGRLFGWLYLVGKQGADEFTELDERLITGLAAHAGVAIETAQLVSEIQGREESLRIKTNQLQAITDAMTAFLKTGDWQGASARLLRAALSQTGSEYGFIGVVVEEGPVLRILAHEGVNWDATVGREFYENALRTYREVGYLEFSNFDNLFGKVITTGKTVIANDPGTDPRAGGLPPGHPPLRNFLGMPIHKGTEVVGMIGIANHSGGYTDTEQAKLEILTEACGVLYDSYRRQQHETALEEQLRQSQKMEAVGQLAGGIAHDFNNLLTVITGSSQFLLRDLDPQQPLYEEAKEIQKAAERAASLTQQLLTFSRKQPLQLRTLDLNEVITDLAPMLQRLLGEDIHLALALNPDHCHVMADSTQLEQVLLNLAINARDAMPEGGALTLETHIIKLDEAHVVTHPGSKPGAYVLLAVSDSGMGMDADTRAHCFEPFFTTKPTGQGTGLGLATVYGIVKQSDGVISVDSAPGQGTTFKIFLPRVDHSTSMDQ